MDIVAVWYCGTAVIYQNRHPNKIVLAKPMTRRKIIAVFQNLEEIRSENLLRISKQSLFEVKIWIHNTYFTTNLVERHVKNAINKSHSEKSFVISGYWKPMKINKWIRAIIFLMFSYVKRVSQMYKKFIKFIQEKKKNKKKH